MNNSAFSKITEESAFFAGLIATDATIRKNGTISLELKAVDEDLLVSTMAFINKEGELQYRTMKNVDGRGIYASFQFIAPQIVNDLSQNFGIDRNKTAQYAPTLNIDNEFSWAHFAGMMAGDGHVRVDRRSKLPIVHFVTKSPKCAAWVESLWESSGVGIVNIYKSASSCCNLQLEGSRALEIYKKLVSFNYGNARKTKLIQSVITSQQH